MFWNILPISELIRPETSWEGHLAGAITGFVCAVIYRKKGPAPDKDIDDMDDDDNDDNHDDKDVVYELEPIKKDNSPKPF